MNFLSALFLTLFLCIVLGVRSAKANCTVLASSQMSAPVQSDALFEILSAASECPRNILQLKALLAENGLQARTFLVANRGRNNPQHGSFSFFETVSGTATFSENRRVVVSEGDFFFGHFTKKVLNAIDLDQDAKPGQLMIELIVWDPKKGLFNFYELIGSQGTPRWFYRGDSQDILRDNQLLYRSQPPQFGRTLRCSGCHVSGGPIMKELSAPHNDWWTAKRPLPFGRFQLSENMQKNLDQIQDASAFSQLVRQGIHKLQASPVYQSVSSRRSLQEQLRPLFCDTEINLVSSSVSYDQRTSEFEVSSRAFLNPLFANKKLRFSRNSYEAALKKYRVQFPEAQLPDADHLWLTPVKGYSDLLAIQSLILNKVISAEFAYDVMALDTKTSLLSKARCGLLNLIPNGNSRNWQSQFVQNLTTSSIPLARDLLQNLNDPQRNQAWYKSQSLQYLQSLQVAGLTSEIFEKLLIDRQIVFQADISKNPLGQILEPGFRVIFPVSPMVSGVRQ